MSILSFITDSISGPFDVFLLVVLLVLIYKLFLSKYFHREEAPPPKIPALPPLKKQDMTVEQLSHFDGSNEEARICVAVDGKIFDVTRATQLYGKDGPYGIFAGRDASRGLATFSTTADAVRDTYDDLSDLNPSDIDSMREWAVQFRGYLFSIGTSTVCAGFGASSTTLWAAWLYSEEARKIPEKERLKKEIKVQLSLSDNFLIKKKLQRNDPKSLAIDTKIAEMIAVDDQPFSHVEDIGFMRLMNEIAPQYDLKTRKYYKAVMVENFSKLKEKIKLEIQSGKKNGISFTTDIWSNEVESLLSLTAHFITSDYVQKKFILHAQPLDAERHTGEYISEVMDQMLADWGIENAEVHAIVRDGGTNMIKALQVSGIVGLNCIAHQLHNIVTKALDVQHLVKTTCLTCRKIAGHFHRSDPARKKLAEIQTGLYPDKQPLRLIQEVSTRWNSTFAMLKRIVEIKEALAVFATENDIDDWGFQAVLVNKVLSVLEPFKETTEKLSGASITLSDALPTLKWLSAKLTATDSAGIGSLVDALKEGFEKRFSDLENNDHYTTATLLDPRYKDRFFVRNGTLPNITDGLKQFFTLNSPDFGEVAALSSSNKRRKVVKKQSTSISQVGSINDFIASSEEDDDDSASTENSSNIEQELQTYLKEKRIGPMECPLSWWKTNEAKYPCLAIAARRYLSPPPTSVPSEQLFSGAGIVYEPSRNRLKGETVEKILFMKYNLIYTKFDF